MAQKTRTAQVFDVVKVLAWVVIAVALVKFAFFPAAQEKQTSGDVDPGGSFGQMTISVGRADITNTSMTVTRFPRVMRSSRSARNSPVRPARSPTKKAT